MNRFQIIDTITDYPLSTSNEINMGTVAQVRGSSKFYVSRHRTVSSFHICWAITQQATESENFLSVVKGYSFFFPDMFAIAWVWYLTPMWVGCR